MKIKKPKIFIIDVDGVMTDGKFYYTKQGKVMKCFGADDNDALKLLSNYIKIRFVTGDKRGYLITKNDSILTTYSPFDGTLIVSERLKGEVAASPISYMGEVYIPLSNGRIQIF